MRKGTRIVQADSGTDPDSENWRRSPRRLPTGWDCRVSADKVQCVDPPEDHIFSGHYHRNRSTLDIGVFLGYIGIF